MSDAAAQQTPKTMGELLDEIAEERRQAGVEALTDDEAMALAIEAQQWARERLRRDEDPDA